MRVSPCLTAFFLACASLPLGAQQGFYREYYAGIAGSRVADLTAAAAFPDAPTVEEVVNAPLETGVNVADYYGQRVRALLTPAVTGSYTFWVATDDGGELWLGTDHTPTSRRRIAYVSGWASSREWTKEASQKSAAITLTAGTRYYIEVLQKENTGGDNLAVAWQVPGTTTTNVIPAAVLTPYLDPPVIRTQPLSLDIEEQWAGLRSATFTVEAVRQGGVTYQWQRDGVNLPGATAPAYTLTADVANSNRLFRCVLSNLAGTVTSAAARYRFVPDVTAPALTAWNVFHDRRILTLGFSEPLDPASATNPAAYAVSGSAVLSATLLGEGSGVTLRLDTPLTAGATHTLALTVQDRAVPANTLALTGTTFVPPLNAPVPAALARGGREPAGPSSRRTAIAITEINHTPAARGDGRDLRFVELYNSNPFYQDLSGYRLSGVFDYTLPTGTVLAANGYLVVAPSPADVTAVTGLQQVVGGFEAYAFDGSGEITLHDALGAWLSTVAYGDDPPWPVAADGSGHTLVLARPSYGERDADGWSASALPGGSPGAADPARPTAFEAVLINEVLAHSGATPGFIELHNLSDTPRALGGCVLKRDDLNAPGFLIPDGTELPARGFLAFHESALGFLIDGSGDTVWLFAPAAAGGTVIDALRLDDQQIGVAHGRFPDGDARWNILETPTPGAANTPRRPAPVVLNEIMYNPISEDKDEEFVELFNPGAQSVNLDGWKLGGGIDYAFGPLSIPAGGYLVVPRDPAAFARLYPDRTALATPDGFGGSLANSRETVTLSQPVPVMDTADPLAPVVVTNNTVVERVTYRDGGEWHALADGGGSSLERIDPRADPALARSWAASDESQKSAWTTLEFTGRIDHGFTASANGDPNEMHIGLMDAGECLIDAVEVRATGGANLVNNPSFESDTPDWRFMGTHDRSAIEPVAGAFDGQRALRLRASDRVHTGMNVIRGAMSATLPKSGTGTIRARVRWLSGCPELLIRTRGNWLEASGPILTTRALGTPGQPNSRAANAAPAIYDVIHQPVLPRTGEKVTVYARLHDPDGLAQAHLVYRVQGQAVTNRVAMRPCAAGFLAAEIPAGLPAGALVAFHIEAEDCGVPAARARFPADAPVRECLVRFSEPLDSRAFGIYRFWMTQENIDYWTRRERASNAPVDATFIYGNDRVLYHAAMMYAGSPFHSNYSSPIGTGTVDYEAIFQNDDTVLDDDGMVLSTVGNLGNDDLGIREQFCFSLVQALGLPHVHRRFVHVYANGTEQFSKKIYEDTEKPNAGVVKHWFPEDDDNDLFKIDDWFEYTLDISAFTIITARLQPYLTDAPDGDGQVLKTGRYRWNWQKRGYANFFANDYANFFSLVETLNTVDPATYTQRIRQEINLEGFAGVIAMNQFIGNYDTYGFNRGKNMYLYDSAAGWQLIAWDLDVSFGANRPLTDPINPSLATFPTDDPTMRTFLKHPVTARVFWRAVEKLLAASADPALRAWTRAKYDALRADATVLNGNYDAYFANVETRCANVAAQLAAANASAFSVTTPAAAASEADSNVVTLSGNAPFAVTALRVNGAETDVTWTSSTTWSAQVVLNNGTNAFQIEAFTADGMRLSGGSVTRTIVYTGTPLDPLDGYLLISEIMAHPVTNSAAYVEIANRSASTRMNLTGVYLDGAVAFAFASGTVLNPGERLLVAADPQAIAQVYGTGAWQRVAGTYSGVLPPAGTLRLRRRATGFEPDDPVLDRVTYGDRHPWPEAVPPGTALQLINPALDNSRPANWVADGVSNSVTVTAVPWTHVWSYFATGYPGDTWTAPAFDDAAWPAGPGPLGFEDDPLSLPLATVIPKTSGRVAYYFRTDFSYSGNPVNATLRLSYMLDDAAAFYLNGEEIHRSALMPIGPLTDASVATTHILPEGQIQGPFALPATALRSGLNTLAVSVHQNQGGSSDLVFGMTLDIATVQTDTCTPGAANASSLPLTALPEVWLNELQPRNLTGPADNAGEREPWVELYNSGDAAVALDGWALATAQGDPGWSFPAGTLLEPGAFLRVWLDAEPGESAPGHLHAGFRFDFVSGTLLLRAPLDGRAVVVDALDYTDCADDAAWGAWPDGSPDQRRWLHPATPGAANRADRPTCRIVINEFMAQNDLFTNPLTGKKEDWFELFNDGAAPVDLGGWVVTDTLTSETPPTPDLRASKALVIPPGVTLAPGAALRIWTGASDAASLPVDPANLQAPFGLGKSGDRICLFTPALALADRIAYATEQSGAASMGRWLNGASGDLVLFDRPTPGAPNRNPRFTETLLAQPDPYAIREEQPFVCTNTLTAARPDAFAFRLFPTEGAALPAGLQFDTASGVLTWTPTEAQGPGLYALRLCGFLVDGLSVTGCDEALLTLRVLETPSRPQFGPLADVTVNEGQLATFTVTAIRTEEIPPYPTATRLRLEGALPSNAVFNAGSGAFTWQTDEPDGPGEFPFTVIAEDADDPSVFCVTQVTVRVNEVNRSFAYASPATFMLWREEPFAVHLRYNDPDLPPNVFSYALLSGPDGLTLDPATGRVQWQPNAAQTGSFSLRVRAFDGAGAALSTTIGLSVDTHSLSAAALTAAAAGGGLELKWASKPYTFYTIEWCADLASPVWHPVNADAPVAGTGAVLSFTLDPAALGSPANAFFRIRQTRE